MVGLLLRNEWRYYRVQPLFWLTVLLTLAFVLLVNHSQYPLAGQPVKALLLRHTQLLMLIQPLLIGVLAPLVFLRDSQSNMDALIQVTPQSLRLRRWVRACGLWLFAAGMQLLTFGLLWFSLADAHPQLVSPLPLLLACLQSAPALLLLVVLPLWCSSRFASPVLLYLQSAAVWLGYMLLAAATGSPLMANSQSISAWLSQLMLYLDPYALAPLLAQLQNDGELPVSLWQLDTSFWYNRALVLSLTVWLGWRALASQADGRIGTTARQRSANQSGLPQAVSSIIAYQACQPQRLQSWPLLQQLLALQWQQICRQRSTVLALLALSGLIFSEVYSGLGYAETFSQLLPDSRDALNRVSGDVIPRFGLLLLAVWAHQFSWLNRQRRSDGLLAATPVPSALLLSSQLIGMWGMTGLLVCLSLAATALAQALLQVPFDCAEYLQQGALLWLPLLVWSPLLLACHALLRSPLTANLAVALLLAFGLSPLPDLVKLQHPLWRIGQTQLGLPDHVWGYQGSLGRTSQTFAGDFGSGGFWPYWLLWALLAGCVFCVAWQRYHRGTGQSITARQHWFTPQTAIASVLAMAALMQGIHLHQQLAQAGALRDSTERLAKRAAYEQQYQHWRSVPLPQVSLVKVQASLQPQSQTASISATLTLHNPHSSAINQILLGFPALEPGVSLQKLAWPGSTATVTDPALGQQVFQLSKALAPGQSTELQLQFRLQQQALAPMPPHQILRPDFSYLRLLQLLPQIGFVPELRLRDPLIRTQYGLAPLPAAEVQPSVQAATTTPASAVYQWAVLDTTLEVPAGYQGIAAGTLLGHWQQGDQQFFHYRTKAPVRNLPALLVVPWQKQSSTAAGVQLELYSPEFNAATDLTMQAMQQTVRWFSQQLGDYPGEVLRLVIMPDIGPTGYALPQLVLINHRVGVRARPTPDAPFSQVFRRTAHEVAHQWFGHGIGNGVPGDNAFLVESVTKYAELVLIEQQFGAAAMQGLVDFEQQRFARAQAGSLAAASSLIDAEEAYDQYSRATLVFARLRAELGDAVILAALRQVWQQHRYPASPASAMDFVRALRAQSPAASQPLIDQLLLGTDIRALLNQE